ncbi:hypothetical protein ACWEGQ_24440, partial [Streptomyces seoulensis]
MRSYGSSPHRFLAGPGCAADDSSGRPGPVAADGLRACSGPVVVGDFDGRSGPVTARVLLVRTRLPSSSAAQRMSQVSS